MFQAISTHFLAPTDTKGPRLVATAYAGRVVVDYDHDYNEPENHQRAAAALAQKLQWDGSWHGGSTRQGYTFVCVDSCTEAWSGSVYKDCSEYIFPQGNKWVQNRTPPTK